MNLEVKRALEELKYMVDDKIFITIVIDADGTIFEHNYPNRGKDLPYCAEVLQKWQNEYQVGYILSTMRSGESLQHAVDWFKDNNIKLFGIQKHPTQEEWTDSPKCHGRFCIDDRNALTPLTLDSRGVPCVDWKTMDELFTPILSATYDGMIKYAHHMNLEHLITKNK